MTEKGHEVTGVAASLPVVGFRGGTWGHGEVGPPGDGGAVGIFLKASGAGSQGGINPQRPVLGAPQCVWPAMR
jgi:hypothetical protein